MNRLIDSWLDYLQLSVHRIPFVSCSPRRGGDLRYSNMAQVSSNSLYESDGANTSRVQFTWPLQCYSTSALVGEAIGSDGSPPVVPGSVCSAFTSSRVPVSACSSPSIFDILSLSAVTCFDCAEACASSNARSRFSTTPGAQLVSRDEGGVHRTSV